MRKLIFTIIAILCIGFLPSKVIAQDNNTLLTVNATPSSDVLSGSDIDSNKVINFDFDTSEIPPSAILRKAVINYSQVNSSTGILQMIDQYSAVIIDSSTLNNPGSKSSIRFQDTVQKWIVNPSSNQGLVFKASSLEPSDEVLISNLYLELEYTVPDKDSPEITNVFVSNISGSSAKLTWETDEDVIAHVEYGKTINSLQPKGSINEFAKSGEILLNGLSAGVTYHFKLIVEDASGNKSESKISQFQTTLSARNILGDTLSIADESVLASPALLNLEPIIQPDEFKLDLAWSESNTPNIDGYIVYRSVNNKDNFVEYHRTNSDVTYFSDESVEEQQTYFYFVRTYKDNLISQKSPEKGLFMPSKTDMIDNSSSSTTEESVFSVAFLILASIGGFTLVTVYLFVKVIRKVAAKRTKTSKLGLKNVLRDPEYYTSDYEGNNTQDSSIN